MNIDTKILNKYFKYFLGFSIVGIFITISSLLLTILLIEVFEINIFIAYPSIYIISTLASYYLNKDHVFKYNGNKNKLFFYFVTYLSSMLLGLFIIAVFKGLTEISESIIAIMVLPFTTIYNFILVSLLFNDDKDKNE